MWQHTHKYGENTKFLSSLETAYWFSNIENIIKNSLLVYYVIKKYKQNVLVQC